MREIRSRGHKHSVPDCIDELKPAQYKYYCLLASALANKVITFDYFTVHWCSYLIGMKVDYTKLLPQHINELQPQAEALAQCFVKYDQASGVYKLILETPINLLPEEDGHKGPGDWLDGMTFGEFVQCLSIIEAVASASDNPEAVAECYRNIARVMYHIDEGEDVSDMLAFHAPRLFASVWHAIQSGPIEINGKSVDLSIIFKGTGDRKPDDKTGWTGITFEVATAGLFGTVKEVESVDFWSILMYLYKCKFEYNHESKQRK
jgi:hypothetical protein